MFCNLLTRKFLCVCCVLALFAVARFLRLPPTLVYIVCAVVSFVVYTVLGISQSLAVFLFVSLVDPLSLTLPDSLFSLSLPFSGICFANENCTRMLPK